MRRFAASCSIAIAITLAVASACVNPTAGVPIQLTLAFEGLGSRTFVTASGWEVELTEARASFDAIYAYAPSDASALRLALGPARAYAHGGTGALDGRVVRAELLESQVLDALAEANDVATLGGFAGELEALTIVLGASGAVEVAGTARRGEEEVAFDGTLALEDERLRRVDGVEVDATLGEGSRLVVGADPSAWLAEADFSGLTTFDEASQPYRALYLGARSAASFAARVEEQPE